MYIVLLSGGSGKRLWPLSNDLCSKQYIKLMNHENKDDEENDIQPNIGRNFIENVSCNSIN